MSKIYPLENQGSSLVGRFSYDGKYLRFSNLDGFEICSVYLKDLFDDTFDDSLILDCFRELVTEYNLKCHGTEVRK